jgi:hypothetical protein
MKVVIGKDFAQITNEPDELLDGGRCPFELCGAEQEEGKLYFLHSSDYVHEPTFYKCGTITSPYLKEPIRSHQCFKNEIAALKERREAWREFYGAVAQLYLVGDVEFERLFLSKLKALGEI